MRMIGGPQIQFAGDSAINHRNSDAGSIETRWPELVGVHSLRGDVERARGGPIRRDVGYLRIQSQARNHRNRDGHMSSGNRAILAIQLSPHV